MGGAASVLLSDPETFRRHALDDILPLWREHAVDRKYGGFLSRLDRRWRVKDADHKDLVPTARLVYNFSQGHLLGGPSWCTELAGHGAEFLLDRFWDPTHGGWFWQVDRQGRPTDQSKRTYGHAFAILALSEFHRATGRRDALEAAVHTYEALDRHAWDADGGGYVERLSRDWTGPDSVRTQNSQMHMVEALLALHETSGERRWLERAEALCRLMEQKLFDHEHGCLPEFFHDDWSDFPERMGDEIWPGHQLEWAWLLLRLRGHRPEQWLTDLARRMAEFALSHGWDCCRGGFYNAVSRTGGLKDRRKTFWQQCEGVMAPLWLWEATGEADYLRAFGRAARFCFERFVDRDFGGWFDALSEDNVPANTDKGGAYRADYHVVQMCAESCRFLQTHRVVLHTES